MPGRGLHFGHVRRPRLPFAENADPTAQAVQMAKPAAPAVRWSWARLAGKKIPSRPRRGLTPIQRKPPNLSVVPWGQSGGGGGDGSRCLPHGAEAGFGQDSVDPGSSGSAAGFCTALPGCRTQWCGKLWPWPRSILPPSCGRPLLRQSGSGFGAGTAGVRPQKISELRVEKAYKS